MNRKPLVDVGDGDNLCGRAVLVLRSSVYHPLRLVRVEVDGGAVITLRGTVPSFYLKQMAQEAVRALGQVVNELEVCPAREAQAETALA